MLFERLAPARSGGLVLALLVFGGAGCAALSGSTGETRNALTLQVHAQPPADKTETRTPSPGFGYIWVSGYWDYLDGNFIWRDGRWVQGRPDYEYVRARYEFDGNAWLFHRPHWKKRQPRQAVSRPAPAPAPAPAAASTPASASAPAVVPASA